MYAENLVENLLGTCRERGPAKSIKYLDADTTSSKEGPADKLQETGCIFLYTFARDMTLRPAV